MKENLDDVLNAHDVEAGTLTGAQLQTLLTADPAHWDFIDLPGFDEASARAWFESRVGQGYDLWGNLRFLFGWVRDDDGRWFCSEALMSALGFDEAWRFGPNGAAAAIKRWCSDITNQPAQAGFFTHGERE